MAFNINVTCNLVKITKVGETKKGTTSVFFTVASQRRYKAESDKEYITDYVFCKAFGPTADFLLRNVPKDENGKHISRKLAIVGTLENFEIDRTINPGEFDVELGDGETVTVDGLTFAIKERNTCINVKEIEFHDNKSVKNTEAKEEPKKLIARVKALANIDTTEYDD